MPLVSVTGNSTDKNGNKVIAPSGLKNVIVEFSGKNNELVIAADSGVNNTKFSFPSDDGVCIVGSRGNYSGRVRIGWKCLVSIGTWVTCTTACSIYTAEETSVIIGDDCMFASGVQLRTEDSHAIFDVETGDRINPSRNIAIGQHVWIAEGSMVLSGSTIGSGTVIGTRSLVKGFVPNNCVAAGSPARVIKRDAAWERPNIAFSPPWVRTNGHEQELVRTLRCWQKTDDDRKIIMLGKSSYSTLATRAQLNKNYELSMFCL